MTDEILNILRPERTIDDDEALRLLREAESGHPEAWQAYQFIRARLGIDEACQYLTTLPDENLHRLALVMPRLERETEQSLHPQEKPVIAPAASSVSIAMQGGAVHYGTAENRPRAHNFLTPTTS